jgi:hypothetical protein
MAKPVTPELIDRILEQQEKNHQKYIESLKTLFTPYKPTIGSRISNFFKKFKKQPKLTDDEIQLLKFRTSFSIGPNSWDWDEDPITCLKQLGENPDDYEHWGLYIKTREKYVSKKRLKDNQGNSHE